MLEFVQLNTVEVKEGIRALKLDLQTVVSHWTLVLGTILRSSGREVHTLNL